MDSRDAVPWADLVEDRIAFLERLARDPAHKPQLEDDLDCSRSTIDRAIRRLEEAGLVERGPDGYVTTVPGRLAARRYRAYVADQQTVDDARPILSVLPSEVELPYELLAGGTVQTAGDEPQRAFERIARHLRTADHYHAALPALADSRHLRLLHARVVHDDLDADLLVGRDLFGRLAAEFPRLVGDLVAAESCSVRRAEVPPFGLVVADSPTASSAVLATYDAGTYVGTVENETGAAVGRAGDLLESLRADADEVEDPPATRRDDGTPLSVAGMRTEGALADAGTTRLDRSYFTDRTPGDPETAWRLGFDLADVFYGYAVERLDPSLEGDETGDVSALLVDRLADGDDRVVVGPPGAGKSTICRQVACRWVKADHGPVFYRESPASGDDLAGLAEVASGVDGHALVVVEDAADGVTESFLQLLAAVRDDPTVTLLGDARERRWHGAVDEVSNPRLRERARTDLASYRVPAVDERTCRRAITAFEAATGREVPLTPSTLLDRVENEGGVGEMYVLSYQVVAHTVEMPWADDAVGPSMLDGDVRGTYDVLAPDDGVGRAGEDETLPLEVGLLVATLAATDRAVTPGVVHAVAATRGGDGRPDHPHRRVEAVVDDLDGRMLVRRDEGPTYRTQHPQWARRFLEYALDRAERETVALFERAVNALLSLADRPERRERIESWLGRESPEVRRFDDPEDVDEFVEDLFALGFSRSTLAPLFGTTEHSGLELPETCSEETRLDAVSCRGKMWYDHGDADRAETELSTLCDRAESAASDDVGATFLAEGYRGLGEVVVDRGDTETAREYLTRSLEAARECDDPRHVVGALNSLAWVAMTVDEYDRAQEHLDEALSIAEDLGPVGDHSDTLYYLARLEHFRGDLSAAEEWLTETVELDREIGNEQNLSSSLKLLADVAKEREAYDRAAEHYRRSIELKRAVRDRPGMAQTLYDLGDLKVRRGDLDAAESAFERSRSIARDNDMRRHEGRVLNGLGRVALERNTLETAADRFRSQREIHDDLNHRRGVASGAVGLGDVARRRGDTDVARERYREAFETYRDIGDVRSAVETLETLVDACEAAGDETAAAEHCETAIDLCEDADLDDKLDAFADRRETLEEQHPGDD